jgi:hypothetical protein
MKEIMLKENGLVESHESFITSLFHSDKVGSRVVVGWDSCCDDLGMLGSAFSPGCTCKQSVREPIMGQIHYLRKERRRALDLYLVWQ